VTPGADASPGPAEAGGVTLHASCVAVAGRAVLIRGGAGSGKSALALELMSRGAGLVADDRTRLWRPDGALRADAPAPIRGLIEARGVGVLRAPPVGPARPCLIVDMDMAEHERLPPRREARLLGVALPRVGNPGGPHLPAAILTYLVHGRHA
jgi:HPr kinase/phosphorylase